MATYKSLLKFSGTLHDLTFYTWRGKEVVRARTSLNRSQVMGSPEFTNSRKAMREFGGASAVSRTLRNSLGDFKHTCTDGQTVNRLNSALLKVIQQGPGPKGERRFSAGANGHLLRGFELRLKEKFGNRFRAPLGLHYTLLADQLEVTIGPFRPAEHLGSPEGATHFRMDILLMCLSDYEWNAEAGKYLPLQEAKNGATLRLSTEWQPLDSEHSRFSLKTNLNGPVSTGKDCSLLAFGAITFGMGSKESVSHMQEGNAMALLDVKG